MISTLTLYFSQLSIPLLFFIWVQRLFWNFHSTTSIDCSFCPLAYHLTITNEKPGTITFNFHQWSMWVFFHFDTLTFRLFQPSTSVKTRWFFFLFCNQRARTAFSIVIFLAGRSGETRKRGFSISQKQIQLKYFWWQKEVVHFWFRRKAFSCMISCGCKLNFSLVLLFGSHVEKQRYHRKYACDSYKAFLAPFYYFSALVPLQIWTQNHPSTTYKDDYFFLLRWENSCDDR